MNQLKGEPSSKMEMMLQRLLEEMRDMKGKLEDVDKRVRTQEIAKQPVEIFNLSDTLYANATLTTKDRNQVILPKGLRRSTSKSSTTSN
ncbi:hypothetical protein H5410_003983 [Solanum commersonii]|uniref:Uncharacterized protein n=1 Tax=Solanum commersonii TaxID=4109 RepID=A0A9J6B6N8_SOLCO|nr:hypothetical protein H5410_003983 [Solanum commersonii]